MSSKKVLVVGELHQDLFYKNEAYTELADSIAKYLSENLQSLQSYTNFDTIRKVVSKSISSASKKIGGESYIKRGGNGNNSATLLAKIDVPVGLLTVVGTGSDWMFSEIESIGIDTTTIYKKDKPTPISTIIEDPEFTKIFVANNLKKDMNFEGITLPETLFDDALITFFTPMDLKYKALLHRAVSAGKITAFTLELQKIDNYNDLNSWVTKKAEFLFCNLDDGLKVCNTIITEPFESLEGYVSSSSESSESSGSTESTGSTRSIGSDGKNAKITKNMKKLEWNYQVQKILRIDPLLGKFANVRIYTLGKYGAWIKFEDKILYRGIIDVPVVNRTGAGDTFAAAFIAKLFEKIKSEEEYYNMTVEQKEWLFKVCLLFATGAAGVKVSTGNTPTKGEVIDLLQKITK